MSVVCVTGTRLQKVVSSSLRSPARCSSSDTVSLTHEPIIAKTSESERQVFQYFGGGTLTVKVSTYLSAGLPSMRGDVG